MSSRLPLSSLLLRLPVHRGPSRPGMAAKGGKSCTQLQISAPHPAKSLWGRKPFSHQDSGLGQPFLRLLSGWAGALLHGEEETRAQLDAPLLGARKDPGVSAPRFSRLVPGCRCFLSNSAMCSFSAGYRGALPGTGSGEEERRHRTQPGMTAPVSASPLLLVHTGTASPSPGTASCPKLPKLERQSLFHCSPWRPGGLGNQASPKIKVEGS